MAMMKRRVRSTTSLPLGGEPHSIIHEGWCVKESGTALFGKTNWRRRWFRLVQTRRDILLQYYRNVSDRLPAGSIRLDVTYCTRQLESHEKPQPNCFAVGPLIDDGAVRTYYISCPTPLAMQEWMAVIDAAIQGVPEQAHRRRETVSKQYRLKQGRGIQRAHTIGGGASFGLSPSGADHVGGDRDLDLSFNAQVNIPADSPTATVDSSIERDDLSDDEVWESGEEGSDDEGDKAIKKTISATKAATVGGITSRMRARAKTIDSTLKPMSRLHLYDHQTWRMEHWRQLCESLNRLPWSRVDTKDGITVARCKFGSSSNGQAIIKVEGILPADPNTVYQFLKISTKDGGKLDYIFRNELLLQEFDDEPQGTIIFNQFLLPLPRVSTRDVVAMKLWIPEYLTDDGSSGFVMFSVDHPEAPIPEKDSKRILIESSGFVLEVHPGPDGKLYTHMAILLRVAFFGALHRMLKGAYNSGLLKIGLRTTFQHIGEQLQRFVEITDI